MKRTILLSYIALLVALALPMLLPREAEAREPLPAAATQPAQIFVPQTLAEEHSAAAEPAPEKLMLLVGGQAVECDMQQYLVGVVAAEMPASFEAEALKAQAVAARSYAMYTIAGGKHGASALCTDYGCCQAWCAEEELRQSWGSDYDKYIEKIRAAVEATRGEYLSYEGQAVFAAFHSSSAGATENSGALWSQLPYLISVESPERAENVPGYVSTVSCSPLDFRDTLLYAYPEADFTAEEGGWIGETVKDESGRVESIRLGGICVPGTKLRSLFSLRSTAFLLEYREGRFVFTVTGYGHGVGMSQYGANVMAAQGAGYRDILAHYYPGTELVGALE